MANESNALPRRVVHIGQRKTGTTWLQEVLRRAAPAEGFAFVNEELARWSMSNQKKRGNVDYPALTAILSEWRDKDAFVSLETLIGLDPERAADAILSALPDAKILVTTRAPEGYLQSSYTQSIKGGKTGTPDKFSQRFVKNMSVTHNLAAVQRAYGAERVRFLPYELLEQDARAFLTLVGEWFGSDLLRHMVDEGRNISPPPVYLELVRRVSTMVADSAPEVIEAPEWSQLLNFSIRAVGQSKDLWPEFERIAARFDLAWTSTKVPDDAWPEFRAMAAPLKRLPEYAPYLAAYGLA